MTNARRSRGAARPAASERTKLVASARRRRGAAVRALAAREPRYRDLLRRVGPPTFDLYPSSFHSLARAIAYQQLAGHAARAIWGRVEARLGPEVTADAILRARSATLRAAGLSTAKIASAKDLARHVRDGRVVPDRLALLDDPSVVATLTQVRGIGRWSAEMHLIFALGRLDVWPSADLGVRKGLARWLGLPDVPTPRAAESLGDPYRPYRTLVAWSMWRVQETKLWDEERREDEAGRTSVGRRRGRQRPARPSSSA